MIEPVRLRDTEDHLLRSEHVEDELHLWIGRPVTGFAPSTEPPVPLWVLDADLFFGTAVETTRLMHRLYGELPPILVVGVAYGTDDPVLQGERRTRDFTPTADAAFEAMSTRFRSGREPRLPAGRRMGRAQALLHFLLEEAFPYLESRFEIATDRSALFGSSLGGLFAVWAFLSEPGCFRHVIAASPALWWDDRTVFDLEEQVAEARDDLPGKLFLAAGSLEEPEDVPFLSRFRLVSNARELAARLEERGYPSLDVRMQVLEGETHTSVVPVALTRGLRAFFHGTASGQPPGGDVGSGA